MFRSFAIPALIALAFLGCEGPHTNPSFPLTVKQAKAAVKDMEADPKPLSRPLILVAGYGDPGYVDGYFEKQFGPCLDDDRIARVDFRKADTFDACRERLVEVVDANFPGGDEEGTVEVDVVANSMGGLIAVYAADPSVDGRRLRIARLFALSAPFQGADTAKLIDSPILIDMRPGSEFIRRLDDTYATLDYEIYPYARLGDKWVGIQHAAPPGEIPWWIPNRAFQPAHLSAFTDPRLHAEVLRRLRGETPYTTEPRAPLPEPTTERPPPTPKP